ncbi:hypothetical protein Tco_0525984 [Tanacetum coccineum]
MKRVLNPTEVLLVVDAITGQEAAVKCTRATNLFSKVAVNNVTLDTTDKDDVFVNSFFETRDAFLNMVQGLDITALYNPEVYCKPRVDEDVAWLSNWPIGNILDAGDKVNVCIFEEEGLVVSVCGSSLEFTDDGEIEQEKNFEYNTTGKEVIGGDLYEFQCETCAKYYLCESCYKMRLGAYHRHRLCPPSKELVGGSKSEQLQKQKSLALKAVLDSLMQPKEQTKAMYSSTWLFGVVNCVSNGHERRLDGAGAACRISVVGLPETTTTKKEHRTSLEELFKTNARTLSVSRGCELDMSLPSQFRFYVGILSRILKNLLDRVFGSCARRLKTEHSK